MLGFVDVRVTLCEIAGEEVGEGSGDGIGEDYTYKRGEGEEPDGLTVEEVWRWGQ
jgi:hypothetical protein